MRKKILYAAIAVAAVVGASSGAASAQAASPGHEHAAFGECVSTMARSGPNQHAAMMGFSNFGEVVRHCQEMHNPPAAG